MPKNATDKFRVDAIPALQDNYIWAIIDTASNHVIIVDPGEAAPVIHYLDKHSAALHSIFITHHHWDHTNGVGELVDLYSVPVYGSNQSTINDITHRLNDGDNIDLLGLSFKVITIPGHTLDHIAYYGNGMLFCGDTLFSAGCGRLFEGEAAQLYHSLQRMAALPNETKVYCAHEYTQNNLLFAKTVEPDNEDVKNRLKEVINLRNKKLPTLPSTLAIEKLSNPFLRCHSPTIIKNVIAHAGHSLTSELEVFAQLRQWKDSFVAG